MKSTRHHLIALVTAPDLKTARRLVQVVLREKLVACANVFPRIESHYWWKGSLETGAEVLILFKTSRNRVRTLEKRVLAEHPYETPEFIVLPIQAGSAAYLDWIDGSVEP